MLADDDAELLALRERVLEKEHIAKQLPHVVRALSAERRRSRELRKRLHLEEADVAALEGVSLRRVLVGVLGRLSEARETEHAEAAEARLELDACSAAVERLGAERTALRQREDELGDAEGAWEAALTASEGQLTAAGGRTGELLTEIREGLASAHEEAREIGEAADCGREAWVQFSSAARLRKAAAGARSSGGDGAAARAVDLMSQAHQANRRGHAAIRRFQTELADVDLAAVQGVDPEEWRSADGVIAPFGGSRTSRKRLGRLLKQFDARQRLVRDAAAELEVTRRELIRAAGGGSGRGPAPRRDSAARTDREVGPYGGASDARAATTA